MSERIYYPIDEKAARLAHDMMSMRDYCEGSKTAAYRNYADRAYDLAERIAQERPKQAERAWRLAERYARKMAENLNAESRIGTRCPSILISGGGNFPVRKKEKQVAHCTYDKDVWHKRIRIYDSTPACGQFRPRTWCRPESCHTCSLCHGRMDDGSFLCSGWPFYKKEGDTPCQNGQAKLGEQLKLF